MTDPGAVEHVLGFSPIEFADSVFEFVDNYLSDGVNEIEKQMREASKRRKLSPIDETVLHECCIEYSELLRSTFYKNMDRFELYANRNIFVPPAPRKAAQAESQATSELDAITKETNALRKQYLELRRKKLQLAQDMQAANSAVQAMKDAQFDVQVATQAFKNQGNTALRDHMRQLANAKRKLEGQIATAEELVQRMGGPVEASVISSSRKEVGTTVGISAPESAEEIAQLTERMKRRSQASK